MAAAAGQVWVPEQIRRACADHCSAPPPQVWDSYGRLLFHSSPFEHTITSVAWAPGGDLFAVGSFNCLALCDKMGWVHSKAHTSSGSLYTLAWAADGVQVRAPPSL